MELELTTLNLFETVDLRTIKSNLAIIQIKSPKSQEFFQKRPNSDKIKHMSKQEERNGTYE